MRLSGQFIFYYFFYEEINTCNTRHLYNFMPPHAFFKDLRTNIKNKVP